MSKIIGIDLGTTNSCVAVVEGGRSVIIPNDAGERTTPSVVAFNTVGERLVGSSAQRQAVVNASRTVSSVKRHMGSDWRIKIDDCAYTPQEISAMILRKLKRDAENYLGEPVTDAVITVPAYFNDIQRQATRDAGRIAGLNVRRIINEPTSAALAYGLGNGSPQKIMVFDLGGGTFDVSIIEIGQGVIEVLATAGDNQLGGDDFDARIVDFLIEEIKKEHHVDLRRNAAALQRIREAAEQAKKELSGTEQASISLPYLAQVKNQPVHFEATLSRAQFNALTRDIVDRTARPVQSAMRDAGIKPSELGKVLLVGGSTRIPAVQEKVRALTGIAPSKSINPDECVAQGAAIQGDILSGGMLSLGGNAPQSAIAPSTGLLLLDVTPLSLSIETMGGVATRLIERNTTLPVRKSQVFSTVSPYQRNVDIHVLQGERPMAKDNKSIGKFKLGGIEKAPAGVPQIEVTFDIDANGILTVSAKDLHTNKAKAITVTDSGRLSESEIAQAMREAEQYAAEDGIRRQSFRVIGEGEKLLARAERALTGAGKQMDKAEKRQIRQDIKSLQRALCRIKPSKLTEQDITHIEVAIEALKQSSAHARSLAGDTDQ